MPPSRDAQPPTDAPTSAARGGIGFGTLVSVGRRAFTRWSEKGGTTQAAALAFYSIFALAPMLTVGLSLGARILGDETAQRQLSLFLEDLISPQASATLLNILQSQSDGALGATLSLSTAFLLFGAAGFVQQVRKALGAPPTEQAGSGPWWSVIVARLISFGIVIVLTIVLVILALATSFAGRILSLFEDRWALPAGIFALGDAALSFLLAAVSLSAMYRLLPRQRPGFLPALAAGVIAAAVFVGSKSLLTLYLGTTELGSAYGAAGSLVMTLVWLYFVSNLFLIGNELAHAIDEERTAEP